MYKRQGAFFEAIEMIKLAQPSVYHEVRPLHVVFGAYRGEITPKRGEPVLFLGDCTTWEGSINGADIRVPFRYTPRQKLNPYEVRHKDVPATIVPTLNEPSVPPVTARVNMMLSAATASAVEIVTVPPTRTALPCLAPVLNQLS